MVVKKGDTVKVDYVGTLEDGTEFDSSEKHGKPIEFEAGAGNVIKGFDDAVIGMEIGDEKDVTIQPEDGYGQLNPDLLKKIPKEQLPKDQEPKVGMILGVGLPNGQQVPATITEVTEKDVTIDLNSPLAGKTLNFHLKLSSISEPQGKAEDSTQTSE